MQIIRGAGSSKGRTSWTAKSELSDYISFTGFFIHYLHYLDPIIDPPASRSPKPSDPILTPIYSSLPVHEWPSPTDQVKNSAIDLVLGGFSYGAMVTTLLPTTDCIMSKYEKVIKGTAAAEIQLRAKSMARTWNQDHAQHRDRRGRSLYSLDAPRRTSGSITIGGDEAEPGTRRPSRDSRRSVDSVGKSLDIRQSLNPRRQSDRGPKMDRAESRDEILQASDIPIPRTHYLLISPIPGPISMLLTFFSDSGDHQRPDACIQGRDKLRILPTLCVYGGSDMVAGQKRLRRWVERHKRENGSRFQFCEVPRAGHFWHEEGVSTELQAAIAQWIKQISGG
jgi:pimeloyl-ACP methyl ester carboxylesterase